MQDDSPKEDNANFESAAFLRFVFAGNELTPFLSCCCCQCLVLPKDPLSFGILIRVALNIPKLYDCLMTELPKIATFSDRF